MSLRTGGVSFFYLRSGVDFGVASRVEQRPHPGMLNEVGFRRPLIMSAGGVAVLIALQADERDAVVERNLHDLAQAGIPKLDRFERVLARFLALGYSANLEDVAPGINSFSVCVLDRIGLPLGSLSVAGEPTRFPETSGRKLVDLLTFEAQELSHKAPGMAHGRAHATVVEAVTPGAVATAS